MEVPEIDPNFEPQIRARSNTWPVRPKEVDVDSEGARTPNSVHGELEPDIKHEVETIPEDCRIDVVANQKKGGSRRNAWGNLSYADLITKAIQNSAEQRLTLSQIYDWMVQNVPYFRDKGDSNSSAGWKNSIRHNLSLHSRFMRVQNEGTGKSSWWVLNPDAKPGKTPRRRATSMDTKAYEKKRGRVKRKVEQLRSAMEGQALGDGGSYGGSARELNLADTFSLTTDFRNRTSSNASSIGRLSPIQYEQDMHDVPQMSPLPWQGPPYTGSETFAESITESLAGMLVGDPNMMAPDGTVQENIVSSSSPIRQQLSPNYQDQTSSYLQVGGYNDPMRQASPQLSPQNMMGVPVSAARVNVTSMSNGYNQVQSVVNSNGVGMRPQARHVNYMPPQTLTELLETPDMMDEEVMDQQALGTMNGNMMLNTGGGTFQVQPQQQQQQASAQTLDKQVHHQHQQPPNNTSLLNTKKLTNLTPQQRNLITTSLLRQVLCSADPSQQSLLISKLQQQLNSNILPPTNSVSFQQGQQGQQPPQQQQQPNNYSQQNGLSGTTASSPSTAQLMSDGGGVFNAQNLSTMSGGTMMSEFDLNLADIRPSDLAGCPDLDQMIKHELSFDDTLDFNFGDPTLQASGQGVDGQNQPQVQQQQQQQPPYNGPLQT